MTVYLEIKKTDARPLKHFANGSNRLIAHSFFKKWIDSTNYSFCPFIWNSKKQMLDLWSISQRDLQILLKKIDCIRQMLHFNESMIILIFCLFIWNSRKQMHVFWSISQRALIGLFLILILKNGLIRQILVFVCLLPRLLPRYYFHASARSHA